MAEFEQSKEKESDDIETHKVSFVEAKHGNYITSLQDKVDTFEYCVTEHLRMSAVYWTLTALKLLGFPVISILRS